MKSLKFFKNVSTTVLNYNNLTLSYLQTNMVGSLLSKRLYHIRFLGVNRLRAISTRQILSRRTVTSSSTQNNEPDRLVLVSKSTNIYANLALEEWLYENKDLSQLSILFFWKDRPCVVIGRHQNPWLECNVREATDRGVDIARRSSGGGTVYHDEGNLNISFIEDRKRYDRRKNLEFVVSTVSSRWDVDLSINCRDDILLDKLYKISGSASRLTRNRTYHHFTLMYKVDIEALQTLLTSPLSQVASSRATSSRRSQVKNLNDYAMDMNFESLVNVLGQQFYSEGHTKNDIMWVDPENDTVFTGLDKIHAKLLDWEWIYGKTPKFSVKKALPQQNSLHQADDSAYVNFEIIKGRVNSIQVEPSEKSVDIFNLIESLKSDVLGVKDKNDN